MKVESDAKSEEKSTCGLEKDMRKLANFTRAHESFKVGTFIGSLYPKQKLYELKIYRGVMCYDNEELRKI